MQRMIREDDPPSPSVRVSTMREGLVALARHRRVEAGSLPKLLQGDMDWIVMKCLEKDRTRRYGTAGDLAADLRRHLENEPVLASPPNVAYRLTKFVRRNRTGVLAGLFMTAALLAGLSLASVGFWRANREAQRATREAARAKAVADFLQEILASIDPEDAARRHLEVEAVTARARELFGDDHATVAATLSSLALQLEQSGNLTAAEPLYRQSIRLWRKAYGDQHANVGITLGRLGMLLRSKGDDAGAEQTLRDALAITGKLTGAAGLASCEARTQLAELIKRRGKLDEAESLVREALAIRRSQGSGQDYHIGATLEQLTGLLSMQGRDQEAEAAFEEMLAAYRPLFPPDSLTAASHSAAFGHWLRQHGRGEKAEPYLREAIRIYRQQPNPPREHYLVCLDGLFQVVRQRKDATDEAIWLFYECMENMRHVYGKDSVFVAQQYLGYAQVLEQDRPVDAIGLMLKGIDAHRKAKGTDWDARPSLTFLSGLVRRVVLASAQPAENYSSAAAGAEALLAEQPNDAPWLALRGMAQYRLGQYELAQENLRTAVESESPRSVEQHAFLAMTHFRLGKLEVAKSDLEQARALANGTNTSAKESAALLAEAETLLMNQPVQNDAFSH
jgi:tetratricopeptide (TPR) repeat protein